MQKENRFEQQTTMTQQESTTQQQSSHDQAANVEFDLSGIRELIAKILEHDRNVSTEQEPVSADQADNSDSGLRRLQGEWKAAWPGAQTCAAGFGDEIDDELEDDEGEEQEAMTEQKVQKPIRSGLVYPRRQVIRQMMPIPEGSTVMMAVYHPDGDAWVDSRETPFQFCLALVDYEDQHGHQFNEVLPYSLTEGVVYFYSEAIVVPLQRCPVCGQWMKPELPVGMKDPLLLTHTCDCGGMLYDWNDYEGWKEFSGDEKPVAARVM